MLYVPGRRPSLVEGTGFNHWTREGSNTDEQSSSVERSRTFEQSGAFERFTLSSVGVAVGSTER